MGGERIEIALVYNDSRYWIAGTYYIQNLIFSLNILEDDEKPLINIYSNSVETFENLKKITKYPYLVFHLLNSDKIPFFINLFNKIRGKLDFNNYRKIGGIDISTTANVLCFPANDISFFYGKNRILAWIPDFQDRYLPSFFTNKEKKWRILVQKRFVKKNIPIVFSSKDSDNDFHKFYKNTHNITYVLHFAVTHPDFSKIDINLTKEKFGISNDFFMCANQFWMHKNHLFLFKAYKKYLLLGGRKQLVCTGFLDDSKNKDYNDRIRRFITDNKLEKDIKIIGFVKREEQLCLMKNCYAVIQPSLFEGWSTVVEDAKKLNKFIFLSNLRVHFEQKPLNVCYFNPYDENELAEKLLNVKSTEIDVDYEKNVRAFGLDFLTIIKDFVK